jgi:methionine-gamma-lyase
VSETDIDPTTPRKNPKPEVTKIDGRALKPATLMMGHGYDPTLSEGSLKPPIFLTSTFAFPSAADGKRHFEGITGKRPGGADGLVYSRFNAPNQEILEDRLSIWDGAEDALSFSSGMTAICVLMLAYASQGDVIVHSGPLYAASEGFVAKVLAKFGVTYVDFPASATREEIDAVLEKAKNQASDQGGKVCMIYLESPGNPTNALVDIEAVKDARDAALDWSCPIAIDNTFLGPLWQRPLDHPNTAWMLLRSLETVELRMQRAGENAAKVCDYLSKHDKVEGLGYLGMIEGARQQDIYDRHCLGAGSTFSLLLKGGEAECFRFLDALKIAKLAVSLGGTETLASHPASMTHLSVAEGRRTELGISDNLVRISIGIEDADDLIADFEQALEQV